MSIAELLSELEAALLELEESPDDNELISRVFRSMHTIKGSGAMFGFDDIAAVSASTSGIAEEKTRAVDVTYRIRFKPSSDIFMNGTNPVGMLNELRTLGGCVIIAQPKAIPILQDINPEQCYIYWDVILTTNKGLNAIKDVFIFVEDNAGLKIDMVDDGGRLDKEADYKKLGEILIERGDLTPDDLEKVLASKKLTGELLVESGAVNHVEVESALVEQQRIKEVRKERLAAESITSVKVPSEKLDKLVDLVGEMVTVQARLSRFLSSWNEPTLLAISEEIERLTAELRDNTMDIRMLPIGTTFSKFKRLVRDLSAELGKDVEITTDGAETELDKTVIERLNDPLVHLIRNSIDHGIETPETRKMRGKPRQGEVHLSAVHSGAHVLIRIRDDGAGIDPESVRAKAAERGLITADKSLPSVYLKPGEMHIAEKPTVVTTVLGSCLSVTMFNPRLKIGAICHGLLPKCVEEKICEGTCIEGFRYVECAIRRMIRRFQQLNIANNEIEVKLFGGADMLPEKKDNGNILDVGNQNIKAALQIMEKEGLPLATYDVGGSIGRKILFHTNTGEVFLKRLKKGQGLEQI